MMMSLGSPFIYFTFKADIKDNYLHIIKVATLTTLYTMKYEHYIMGIITSHNSVLLSSFADRY